MGAFKDNVYWPDQCKYCISSGICPYFGVSYFIKLLESIPWPEKCYGTLSFWCDSFEPNKKKIFQNSKFDVKE